jgi:hypothetical protein
MRRLARRSLLPGIVTGILLIATLTCYTPRQIQVEKEAIAQFAVLEESIYVPPDVTLLAENYSSGYSHEYVGVSAVWIYATPHSCEKIIAEYQEEMTDSGWTATTVGSCDQEIWLYMHTSGAQFFIYAEPPEPQEVFPLWKEWESLQKQYQGLYCVTANLAVGYDEP